MDRRGFFKQTRKQFNRKQTAASVSRGVAGGLTPYAGAWTKNEVAHLLKRTMFGATKADIDHFITLSPSQAVDELVNNTTVPSPPVRDYGLIEDENGAFHDDVGVAIGQTWINDPNTSSFNEVLNAINQKRIESLKKWWAGLIINQGRSVQEKMVMFWHHHFSVQREEVGNCLFLWHYHNLLRTSALGDIKTLVRDVSISPAMLLHLNGYLNSKQAADENFARELQELMTIGKGTDSAYTENDVIAAAKVMTGWRIDDFPVASHLEPSAHDTTAKTFSAFYNNTTIAGSSSGTTEVDALINMIFNTTECARFICRKLYKWFVYYDIDDATEANVIIPLADLFRSSNFNIKPVISALLKSEHFFDAANQACYIKSPYDIVVGTMREFNVAFPPYTNYTTGYPLFESIYDKAAEQQQDLFQPPDVSGWPSYYQEPMFYEMWVNSNSLPRRADYTDALVNDAVVDVRNFATYSSNPADPDQLVSDVTGLLLRYPLSANSKNYIKTRFLLNNGTDNTVWTNAWNSNNAAVVNPALQNMFKFIMNLPEFHLC